MKRRLSIKDVSIVKLFALIYPLCPYYFYLGNFAVKDYILAASFIMVLILGGHDKLKISKKTRYRVGICIWCLSLMVVQLSHGEYAYIYRQLVLWFGMVILVSKRIKTKEDFLGIIDSLILGAFIAGVFGFVEEIFHFNIFSVFNTIDARLNYNEARLGIYRIISFASHAISYGAYCMMMFALILYRISLCKNRKYYVAAFVVGLNALLTFSRISLLGLFLEIILYFWFSGYRIFLKRMGQIVITGGVLIAIGCLVSSRFRDFFSLCLYSVLVIFDDSYISILREGGFLDNTNAIGHRLRLYQWVLDEMHGNYLFGNGAYSQFIHNYVNNYGYTLTKGSIEIQFLRTFYRYGIVGMVSETVFYVLTVIQSFRDSCPINSVWEEKITFNKVVGIIYIAYILVMFGVMTNEEIQLLATITMLLMAYSRHQHFQ